MNLLILWTVPECLLHAACLLATRDTEGNQALPLDLEVHGPEEEMVDKHLIHCTQ